MTGGPIIITTSKPFPLISVSGSPLGMAMAPPLLGEPSDYILNGVSPDDDTPHYGEDENFAPVAHDKL